MRIIKPGLPPEQRKTQAYCPLCNCRFEFLHSETTLRRSARDEHSLHLKCPMPTCPQSIIIPIRQAS